jgi:hypothetical protein
VEKPSPDTKVSISLRQSENVNSILICTIADGGLQASSGLRVGQKVLRINGAPCPEDATDAARRIGETTQTLTIEAANIDWGGATLGETVVPAVSEEDKKEEDKDNFNYNDAIIISDNDNIHKHNNIGENVVDRSPMHLAAAEDHDEEAELTMRMMIQAVHTEDDEDDHDIPYELTGTSTEQDDGLDLLEDMLRDLKEDMTEAKDLFQFSKDEQAALAF